ncbi:MAG: hypothetical protein H0V17_12635 [Deltaproteobacteria bacterium]|nr:hypothetical protein [Deltaproteobacteria bacterium]
MPDVSCPDPDEMVSRAILAEELKKEFERFRVELNADFAQHLGAYEEAQRLERIQENRVNEENLLAGMRAILQPVETQVAGHETRIVRLETRPAKRRAAPKRKPK